MIISQNGVKRSIEGPFALCLSRDELEALAKKLTFLHGGMVAAGYSYGWVMVDISHPDKSALNTPPRKWED